jgi:hypothetical protein
VPFQAGGLIEIPPASAALLDVSRRSSLLRCATQDEVLRWYSDEVLVREGSARPASSCGRFTSAGTGLASVLAPLRRLVSKGLTRRLAKRLGSAMMEAWKTARARASAAGRSSAAPTRFVIALPSR